MTAHKEVPLTVDTYTSPWISQGETRGEVCLLRCSHPARTLARTVLAPLGASTFAAATCISSPARTARTFLRS